MLQEEIQCFDAHLEEWLATHADRFVLIKGANLVGFFDTNDAALREGARRFGLSSFLVRRVSREPEEARIPALTLGLLNAHFTY